MPAGPINDSMKWTSDRSNWLAEEFDDTFLVFFRGSAETHFLNFLSFGALRQLSDRALDLGDLANRLREEFSLTEEELPEDLVRSVIEQLDETGLISPVGPS